MSCTNRLAASCETAKCNHSAPHFEFLHHKRQERANWLQNKDGFPITVTERDVRNRSKSGPSVRRRGLI